MVSRDYKPNLKPEVVKNDTTGRTEIRCTGEALSALGIVDGKIRCLLEDAVISQSICPRVIWFRDTPEVRAALKITE